MSERLTDKQSDLIIHLGICGQMSAGEIMDAYRDHMVDPGAYNWVGWDQEGIRQTLKRLEKRGLVERVPARCQGATWLWRLTERGIEVFRDDDGFDSGTRERHFGVVRREPWQPEMPTDPAVLSKMRLGREPTGEQRKRNPLEKLDREAEAGFG